MSECEKFYEGVIYQTSTGRNTSPVPKFNSTKAFHSWLISESIAEAEHRNDWFNEIWLDGLKKSLAKSTKEFPLAGHVQSVLTYLFDKAYIESQTYKRYLKRQAKRKGEKH